MPASEFQPPVQRLAASLDALCDFLTEPNCRQCEVLAVCLQHLQDDAAEYRPTLPARVLRSLRRVSAFPYVRRRFDCRRCVPAHILAAYLTPGAAVLQAGGDDLPALSWMTGEHDIHW